MTERCHCKTAGPYEVIEVTHIDPRSLSAPCAKCGEKVYPYSARPSAPVEEGFTHTGHPHWGYLADEKVRAS